MLNTIAVAVAQEKAAKIELIEIDFEWRRCYSVEDVLQIWTGKSLSTVLYEESYATSTLIIQKLLLITHFASACIAWLHQNA